MQCTWVHNPIQDQTNWKSMMKLLEIECVQNPIHSSSFQFTLWLMPATFRTVNFFVLEKLMSPSVKSLWESSHVQWMPISLYLSYPHRKSPTPPPWSLMVLFSPSDLGEPQISIFAQLPTSLRTGHLTQFWPHRSNQSCRPQRWMGVWSNPSSSESSLEPSGALEWDGISFSEITSSEVCVDSGLLGIGLWPYT